MGINRISDWYDPRGVTPTQYRDPRELFSFSKPGDLQGWSVEGEAFAVAPVPSLFNRPTLNSLAAKGEAATGRAISPEFTISESDSRQLEIEFQGGRSKKVGGEENLCLRVVDAKSGKTLRELVAPGTHAISETVIPLDGLGGRTVRLELIDRNADNGYAWIGLCSVRISSQ